MKAFLLVVSLLTPARSSAADAPKDKTEVVQTLETEEAQVQPDQESTQRKPATDSAEPDAMMKHTDQGDRLEKPFSRLVFPTNRI